MVKINSTSGLADMDISDFHYRYHITCYSTLTASLVKIGGKLRPADRSTRLCDRLTHWHTDEVVL